MGNHREGIYDDGVYIVREIAEIRPVDHEGQDTDDGSGKTFDRCGDFRRIS